MENECPYEGICPYGDILCIHCPFDEQLEQCEDFCTVTDETLCKDCPYKKEGEVKCKSGLK